MNTEWPKAQIKSAEEKNEESGRKKGIALRKSEQDLLDFLMYSDALNFTITRAFENHRDGKDRVAELKNKYKEFMNNDIIDEGAEISRNLDECASLENEKDFSREVNKAMFPIIKFAQKYPWKNKKGEDRSVA